MSEQTNGRSGARERSEQCGASERVSGASERASGRASDPLLTSRFQDILDHCATGENATTPRMGRNQRWYRKYQIHVITKQRFFRSQNTQPTESLLSFFPLGHFGSGRFFILHLVLDLDLPSSLPFAFQYRSHFVLEFLFTHSHFRNFLLFFLFLLLFPFFLFSSYSFLFLGDGAKNG